MDNALIGIFLFGGLALFCAVAGRRDKSTAGTDDEQVTAANIRRGVKRGWYEAALCRINGQPYVRLSGKGTDGKEISDVFPITENDYDALIAEGYLVVRYE